MATPRTITMPMKPYEAAIDLNMTAVIIIDMQRDFLEVRRIQRILDFLRDRHIIRVPLKWMSAFLNLIIAFLFLFAFFLQPGGFGDSLGNDVSLLQRAVEPCQKVLEAARRNDLLIIHTREGHRKELSNLHSSKLQRPGAPASRSVIGKDGPKGRILVQGEPGHDIIPELYPRDGEPIVDKPGKGSFYATDLDCILKANGIETLIVCGVTTEVCVHTTIREGK